MGECRRHRDRTARLPGRQRAPGPDPGIGSRSGVLAYGGATNLVEKQREYYPSIYRHLLYLAGQREVAEDLTRETFFHAWRHLDRFEGRAPLRHWLHRIAHREFLRSLRSRRAQVSQEDLGDLPAPRGRAWTD